MYRWEGKNVYTSDCWWWTSYPQWGEKIIDWESLGFSEIFLGGWTGGTGYHTEKSCGSCTDRDIVIPFMDGLRLTEILSREFPQIHVVDPHWTRGFSGNTRNLSDLEWKNFISPETLSDLPKPFPIKWKEICEASYLRKSQETVYPVNGESASARAAALQERAPGGTTCSPETVISGYLAGDKKPSGWIFFQAHMELGLWIFHMGKYYSGAWLWSIFCIRNIVEEWSGKRVAVLKMEKAEW